MFGRIQDVFGSKFPGFILAVGILFLIKARSTICCFKQTAQSFESVGSCNRNENICISPLSHLTGAALSERYQAAMVLGGAGDAIGYKRGDWEFETRGSQIHMEVEKMGGIKNIVASLPHWIVSDDTVMHLATAEGITQYDGNNKNNIEDLYMSIAVHYKDCMDDMVFRSPGTTCIEGISQFRLNEPNGYIIPFNQRGGGCGAAMRAMCIGLYYPRPEQLDDLVALSIESGRMTHNHPTGYLGSLASALFTHLAVQGHPVQSWGAKLVKTLDKAWQYVEAQGRDVGENRKHWNYFGDSWKKYLLLRGIEDGFSMPQFPDVYSPKERDEFYKSISFSGWGGSSGHDAPMIAYDAFLGAGNNWEKLSERAFFHGGDSDSTAIIAATWFGVFYGYKGVPEGNYKHLEYRERLEKAGIDIFNLVKHHFK